MFQPGDRIGPYTLVRQIGVGGFGVVWLAERRGAITTTRLALKMAINEQPDLRSVQQEADLWVRAEGHVNVLPIIDADIYDGHVVIASEYAPDGSLKDWLYRHGGTAPTIRAAVDMTIGILTGLEHLHSRRIIHRDLKPGNILLQGDTPRIADFGIARIPNTSAHSGSILGTLEYMAPETFSGHRSEQTDLWSVGVILYQLLTGRMPFFHDDRIALMYAIAMRDPQPLPDFIPEQLKRVVRRSLQKDAGLRYRTSAEMLDDLRSPSTSLVDRILRMDDMPTELVPPMTLHIDPPPSAGSPTNPVSERLLPGSDTLTQSVQGTEGRIHEETRHSPGEQGTRGYVTSPSNPDRQSPQQKEIDSLAILPFVNASADPDLEYLSDGITESIINSLSQLPKLRVMARSTMFRYKGQDVDPQNLGRKLNVCAVLMGKVQQRVENLKVQVELVDVGDGSRLWGEQYNQKLSDIFEVEEEIANRISEKLRLKLTDNDKKRLTKRYTDNTEAYQLYLKGCYYTGRFTKEGIGKGIEFFNQAIGTDPNYALAYAGLADAYYRLSNSYMPSKEAIPKAKAAAIRALELDDALSQAHTSLAVVRGSFDWDLKDAEKEFKRAIELNPGYAPAHHRYGLYLVITGRFDEAIEEVKRAQQLDPLSLSINAGVGLALYFARRYDLAIKQFQSTIDMDRNFYPARIFLGWTYGQKGDHDEAIAELQKASQLDENPEIMASLGYSYAISGRKDEALAILGKLKVISEQRYVSAYNVAAIYTGLGEKEQAFEWLQKAYEDQSEWLVWIKVDPWMESLRTDPRFLEMMQRVGLAPNII